MNERKLKSTNCIHPDYGFTRDGGYDEGAAAKEPMQLFTKNIGLC